VRTIWKFPIEINDVNVIMIPIGAEILCVQIQYDEPWIWAIVDPEIPKEPRVFRTFGTGTPIEDNPGNYIGTYQLRSGSLVFHVFETGPAI